MEIKIYLITNRINGKQYVGQTSRSLKRRFYEHSRHKSAIGKAIKKYGRENFTIETIDVCETFEMANEREQYWIAFYGCVAPNGYNLTEGGKNGARSEETCRKLSIIAKKNGSRPPVPPKKVSLKKQQTPEQIHAKRVKAGQRRAQTPEGRAQIWDSLEKARAARTEKCLNNEFQVSTEAKENMAVSAKRRAQTPEGRAQILDSLAKARAAHSEKCRQRREQQANNDVNQNQTTDKEDQNG